MKPITKGLLIGCGSVTVLAIGAVVWLGVWLVSGPESGVKLGNEMDPYALDYMAEHDLLEEGEEILAYYDVTMAMDGTEAAILTTDRVIYHKQGNTTSIRIGDIEDIRHRYEAFIGDVIEIQATSGHAMKIEIAPLNQGETFKNVLMSAWKRAGEGMEGRPSGGDR